MTEKFTIDEAMPHLRMARNPETGKAVVDCTKCRVSILVVIGGDDTAGRVSAYIEEHGHL